MGRPALSLKGQRFGKLTVMEQVKKDGIAKDSYWLCHCDCENTCTVTGSSLKSGRTQSCGCLNDANKRARLIDITGQRYGKLIVIEKTDKIVCNKVIWRCLCDCGNETEATARNLIQGNVQSCGCIKKSILLEDCVENTRLRNLTSSKRKRILKDSGVKGVVWDPDKNKWKAQLGINGKHVYLGRYDTIEEATEARKKAEEIYFKPILENYKE